VIPAARPGVTSGELNAIAAELFDRAGQPTARQQQAGIQQDRGFYHGLGHGVGLEVHEAPSLAHNTDTALLEGEALCIEPALYRIGFGGCRLEDQILVTHNGSERLSNYEYSLTP
jgi:Xaa-Pro aminopeptidase